MLNGRCIRLIVASAVGALLAGGCIFNAIGGYLVDYAITQIVN